MPCDSLPALCRSALFALNSCGHSYTGTLSQRISKASHSKRHAELNASD